MTNSLTIAPTGAALGARIDGVDLATLEDDSVVAQIRRALLQHQVVFFRDQQLDAVTLRALARQFGEPVIYPFVAGLPDVPEVVEVRKEARETVNFGGLWHTDTSYLQQPPLGSILYAVEVPPSGGDTLFASMTRAYQALPADLARAIAGRRGLNSSRKSSAAATRVSRIADNPGDGADEVLEALHPLVRTHPETGEPSLYCSDAHTVCIDGMDPEAGEAVLQQLYEVQQSEAFQYRFQWRAGSVAFWDNRCTQHNALNDYQGHRRVMLRATIAGDTPR